jgi:transcription antitermination factor NusG
MKFRYQEKVRVRNGFFRNYKGVVTEVQKGLDGSTVPPTPFFIYKVKVTITKDPLLVREENFSEEELKRRLF